DDGEPGCQFSICNVLFRTSPCVLALSSQDPERIPVDHGRLARRRQSVFRKQVHPAEGACRLIRRNLPVESVPFAWSAEDFCREETRRLSIVSVPCVKFL